LMKKEEKPRKGFSHFELPSSLGNVHWSIFMKDNS